MHPITTNNRNHRNRFNPWTRDNNKGMERWLISTVTGYAHIHPTESGTLTFKLQRQLTLRKKTYSNVDHTLDADRFENDFLMEKQLSREEWMEWASHIDNDNAFNSEVQSSSNTTCTHCTDYIALQSADGTSYGSVRATLKTHHYYYCFRSFFCWISVHSSRVDSAEAFSISMHTWHGLAAVNVSGHTLFALHTYETRYYYYYESKYTTIELFLLSRRGRRIRITELERNQNWMQKNAE